MLNDPTYDANHQVNQPLRNNFTEFQDGTRNVTVDASDSKPLPQKSEISLDNASKLAFTAKKF